MTDEILSSRIGPSPLVLCHTDFGSLSFTRVQWRVSSRESYFADVEKMWRRAIKGKESALA